MISEEVMKIFTNCAKFHGEEFDIDNVDGGTSEIAVDCDEDYLVGMAYVADCHTFVREVNLEKFDLERERAKMVDLFLQVLKFEWTIQMREELWENQSVIVNEALRYIEWT